MPVPLGPFPVALAAVAFAARSGKVTFAPTSTRSARSTRSTRSRRSASPAAEVVLPLNLVQKLMQTISDPL